MNLAIEFGAVRLGDAILVKASASQARHPLLDQSV
jgi:hypothetical protein